jgi:hypothetical protein
MRHQQNDRQHIQYRAFACRSLIYLTNNICRTKRVELNFTQSRWPHAQGPDKKMSSHAEMDVTESMRIELVYVQARCESGGPDEEVSCHAVTDLT